MSKKGGDFEIIALDFLEKIFSELNYAVTRKRTQKSGSQDGYDNLIEIVDSRYRSYTIYSECKDYKTNLNYTQAIEKIPHIISTHKNIDLLLFISPFENFSNTNENSKLEGFYQTLSEGCPVEFLMPESYVEDYFRLYPELYKKVYDDAISDWDAEKRNELLKKFEKLIFSSKNLKRIVIIENDREKYIGKISRDKFHILRNFRKFQDRGMFVFDNPDYQIDLEEQLNKSDYGAVVLGNPGFGKSYVLKDFSIELWESRENNLKIPKFLTLKDFNTDTKIEDLLPRDYKHISNLIVILDGLDEVHNITDFTNKLRSFITDNADLIKRNRFKFVLSCRTSIYNKYVKDLFGFEICFLNEVSEGLAAQFLLKKYSLDLRTDSRFNFWKYRDILENPFYLVLLGEHYKKTGEILLNRSKLIEKYVQGRLEEDENIKYRNDSSFDLTEILETSKKIALSMEAMQKTVVTKSEISAICGKTLDVFKNPFLQESLDNTWSFEHKNIQEYFVAKILVTLSFEEIIDFIRIDSDLNKIHPTWINVVSFLLNLDLPEAIYNKLIDWISENDIQFIFEADYDRISDEIRIKCLQEFFEDNCINDTLWIDNSSEIANFGNVEKNVTYLIEKAKDKKLHNRTRISAVSLLSHMSFSETQIEAIEQLILQVIEEFKNDNEANIFLLHDSLKLIQNSKLKENLSFYQNVFDKLKPYDYKDVVDAIIYSLPEELIESNLDYFLEILDKSIGEKKWTYPSNTRNVISRKESVFSVFKKVKNCKPLLKIYSFLIERHKNHEIRENLIKDFLEQLKVIFVKHSEVYDDLICIISDAVLGDKIRYYEDDLLVDLIKSCQIEKEVFFKVFNLLSGNYSQKSFLAEIVREEFFPQIAQKYNDGKLNIDFLQGFRNIISHGNIDLSIAFENVIESSTRYKFLDKIDKEKIIRFAEFQKKDKQREFDVLFDREELQKQMVKIFDFKKKNKLTYKDMDKFYKVFHNNDKLRENVTVNAKDILWEIIRKEIKRTESLSVDDLSQYVQNYDLNIINDILGALPKENEQNIVVSESQENYIKNWCVANTEKVNEAYSRYMLDNDVWSEKDYLTFETIFKLQKYFKFNLDEELLLNMIWLSRYMENMDLDFLSGIVTQDKITERVIENIHKTKDENSIYSYIKYFVENNIDLKVVKFDIKEKVKEFLLADSDYYARRLIELLYSNDLKFLQEIIHIKYLHPKRYILDFVLNLIIKQNKTDIVEKYLIDNYDTLVNNQIMEEANIVKNLILSNSDEGFKKLRKIVESNPKNYESIDNNFNYATWQNYSNRNAIDDLIKILELGLVNEKKYFAGRHFSPIRLSTEAIVSICQNHDSEFCENVLEKLDHLNLNQFLKTGGDLFYINKLRKDIEEIILNHKSKPYNLKSVLNLIECNKHIFYL